jgi:DNA-binding transcriptional LysR family regulator
MQGFVAAGVGVSLIAELGLSSVRDDIAVRSLGRDTPVREVFAATAADAYRTPATEAMLGILADVAGRYERRPQLKLVS